MQVIHFFKILTFVSCWTSRTFTANSSQFVYCCRDRLNKQHMYHCTCTHIVSYAFIQVCCIYRCSYYFGLFSVEVQDLGVLYLQMLLLFRVVQRRSVGFRRVVLIDAPIISGCLASKCRIYACCTYRCSYYFGFVQRRIVGFMRVVLIDALIISGCLASKCRVIVKS